ncbi:MAG: hypothetical protein RL322_144 [Pseudomonadota bacterium]|jgi:inner membrane protein
MDSISQIALGASVSVAVMGTRVSLGRAAVWGGLAGTLPDLDTFIDFGDAILNMVRHRAESHSLIYLALAAPVLAWVISRVHREPDLFHRWWLAMTLALVTHPLLDWFTVYGTQLLQPFSDYPFGLGSIFIIDPLFTLPLILGLALAGILRRPKLRMRANLIGLALAGLYLAWSASAQHYVASIARQSLPTEFKEQRWQMLVTPAPFNTVLWRLVVVTNDHYYEAWYSLFDPQQVVQNWRAHERGAELIAQHATQHPSAARIAAFSKGFYSMDMRDGRLHITDLRMGQEPFYSFRFDLGPHATPEIAVRNTRSRPPLSAALPWLWARMLGDSSADSMTIGVGSATPRTR